MLPLSSSANAPIAMVLPSPLTDTASPKKSISAPSGATSLTPVGGESVPHPPDGRVNTYAAPVERASFRAPTAIVLPSALTDTDAPRLAPMSLSEGRTRLPILTSSHSEPGGNVKTCATLLGTGAVAATVLPSALTDTEYPLLLRPVSGSLTPAEVVSHPPDGLVNTYAAPLRESPAGAPTAIVLPSEFVDTDHPN